MRPVQQIVRRDLLGKGRERTADLPVIYMTGDSAAEWTSQGVPNSILVAKPFAINQVVTAVSQLLNAHGTGSTP
uniref:hypothetical protein n=1 Tax=Sphingomonas sp. AR_OL41 TaxID=3042729 RepID=UPI0024817CAB|nr:hypothetical protein [Sphingomonas sp. AR_OL41]